MQDPIDILVNTIANENGEESEKQILLNLFFLFDKAEKLKGSSFHETLVNAFVNLWSVASVRTRNTVTMSLCEDDIKTFQSLILTGSGLYRPSEKDRLKEEVKHLENRIVALEDAIFSLVQKNQDKDRV